MKIIRIAASDKLYSSNAFLILGDWKRIEDVNTLIDTGSDPDIVDKIMDINTGLGKRKIDHVIITHDHSDHTASLPLIKKAFKPRVFAFSPYMDGVDWVLKGGDRLRVGDRMCDILHFPGHSDDSVIIHNAQDGDLFAGDAPLILSSSTGSYDRRFRENLALLSTRNIKAIYFGHGEPLLTGAKQAICASVQTLGSGRDPTDTKAQKRAVEEAMNY